MSRVLQAQKIHSDYDDIESMGSWSHRFEVIGNIFEGVDK